MSAVACVAILLMILVGLIFWSQVRRTQAQIRLIQAKLEQYGHLLKDFEVEDEAQSNIPKQD